MLTATFTYQILKTVKMKPLLFVDFDGTLCFDKFWRSTDKEQFAKIQALIFKKGAPLVNGWMRGRHTSETINQLVADELGVPYETVWEWFMHDCRSMSVSVAALGRIQELRAKFRSILVTDNMDCFTRFTVPGLGLDQHFDQIVNSFETGKLKMDNEGEVFWDCVQEAGVSMEDCVLIDNSKGTCDQFTKLGGRACFVDDKKTAEYWLNKL